MTGHQMVAAAAAILLQASQAEHAAATGWEAPIGETASRWGRRQARTVEAWAWRWRGLAHEMDKGSGVAFFGGAGFDDGAAERLAAERGERRRR